MEIEAKFCSNVEKRIMHVALYVCLCLQIRQKVSQETLEMVNLRRTILSCCNELCVSENQTSVWCETSHLQFLPDTESASGLLNIPWLYWYFPVWNLARSACFNWLDGSLGTSELQWILCSPACWVWSNLERAWWGYVLSASEPSNELLNLISLKRF